MRSKIRKMAPYLIITVFVSASVSTTWCQPPLYDGFIRDIPDGTKEAYMIPPYKSNHASFLERLPNGDMVMAWFSGSKEGESDVAIVVSRLPNASLQWSKAATVSQRKGYSNQNPVLFYDNKTNNLHLFHTQQEAKKVHQLNSEDSAEIWALNSTSGGERWTTPKVMFTHRGSFDRNRIVISLKNTWLYPIYNAGGSSKDQSSNLKECVSHNVFDNWLDHPFTDSNYLVQPSMVRPNGSKPTLVTFFRDRRAQSIYRSVSTDDGNKWSKPTKTTLPNNNSGIEATVLQSGRVAIVYNPTHSERNPISISLSEDDGMTWKYTRNLEYLHDESRGRIRKTVEFSYPTVLQDPAGRIHVSYTYNRDTIKHRIIPNEAWIMQK